MYNISRCWVDVLIFYVLLWFRDGSDKRTEPILWKFRKKIVMETIAMIRQAFGEESMVRTRKSEFSIRKTWDKRGEKSRAYSSFSLTSRDCSKRICLIRPNSQCSRNTVTSYGDWVKNVRRLRPGHRPQRNWLLNHDNAPTSSFTRKFFFYQKQHMLSRLQMKLKDRHFATVELM
jgi:hypothetical protein